MLNFLIWYPMSENKLFLRESETNSVWYGASDSWKMALSESLEVQSSYHTTILAKEGPPTQKMKKIS